MPKVGSYSYRNQKVSKYLTVDVFFGNPSSRGKLKAEHKKFFITLPHEVFQYSGRHNVTSNTMEGVITSYKDMMDEYYDMIKTEKKVIAYKLRYKLSASEEDAAKYIKDAIRRWDVDHSVFYNHNKDSFNEQLLALEFKVGIIETIGDREFFVCKEARREIKGHGGSTSMNEWRFVDHTDKREKWFIDAYQSMSKLINGVKSFFDQDEAKFIESIETSSKLLN